MEKNNTSKKMENIKSTLEKIKTIIGLESKLDFDLDLDDILDKNKVINDIQGLILDLSNTKKSLNSILDCVNLWKVRQIANLNFSSDYKLANGIDYLQTAIRYLLDFCESNSKNRFND